MAKYRVSYIPTGSMQLNSGNSVNTVEFKVSWNGQQIASGQCTRTALSGEDVKAIQAVWKDVRKDFTPFLPAPAPGLLNIVGENFRALDAGEAQIRAKFKNRGLTGTIRRMAPSASNIARLG